MYRKICLTFLLIVCALLKGYCDVIAPLTNLSEIAYSVCLVNTFCKTGIDREPAGQYSCCKQCACDPACYIGQGCCPDSDTDNLGSGATPCKSMSEHFDAHRNIRLYRMKVDRSFYAIDSCKDEFNDADVISGCLVPRTLREHVFVTDRKSFLIYKNYQCAICNGVSSFEFWNLRLVCQHNDVLYRALDQEKYILDKCSLSSVSKPSSESDNSKWTCRPSEISQCNVTGEWDVYDDVIVDACAMFNMPYMTEEYSPTSGVVVKTDTYKNVYCFLCNRKSGSPINSVCSVPEPPDNDKYLAQIPFEALLSIYGYDEIQKSAPKEHSCKILEMETPKMECVDMYCPFGLTPVYGECKSLMQSTNLTVTAIFEFDHVTSTTTTTSGIYDSTGSDDWKYDVILETIKKFFEKYACQYCCLKIYTNLILIEARTTEACPHDKLLRIMGYIAKNSGMRVEKDNKMVEIKWRLSVDYSLISEPGKIFINRVNTKSEAHFTQCASGALLKPKFYCKRIKFSLEQLTSGEIANGTITRILSESEPMTFVNGTAKDYVICVDKYTELVNDAVPTSASMAVLIVLLCVVMLL